MISKKCTLHMFRYLVEFLLGAYITILLNIVIGVTDLIDVN